MKRLLFVTILSISVAMAYGRGISGVTSDYQNDKSSYQHADYFSEEKDAGSSSTNAASTGDQFLDAMVEGIYEMKEPLEETFKSQYGLDVSILVNVDTNKHEIIFGYEFSDKSIYDIFDVEAGAEGALNGIITSTMESDPSGTTLELFADHMKVNMYNMRVLAKYKDYTKSKLITFKDVRMKVDAYFGD